VTKIWYRQSVDLLGFFDHLQNACVAARSFGQKDFNDGIDKFISSSVAPRAQDLLYIFVVFIEYPLIVFVNGHVTERLIKKSTDCLSHFTGSR
jgi:hypothetical protein